MGLVDYSDSEGSDSEAPPTTTAAPKAASSKPTFQKVINRSEPKKIKVELPSIKPEPAQHDEESERPAKRARTAGGGAFGGFNAMLPKPKGRVQGGPKAGVSLKTSSEAAFSRAPVSSEPTHMAAEANGNPEAPALLAQSEDKREEPMIVGKATRFKPLSVATSKKKTAKKAKPVEESNASVQGVGTTKAKVVAETDAPAPAQASTAPAVPASKPKRSLFSVQADDDTEAPEPTNGETYESITTAAPTGREAFDAPAHQTQAPYQPKDPNSLQSIASDLNLTPAQRRQLFGRNSKNSDVNVAAHFNMDSEYAANEQARQAGDVVEHRAVKSIAPGKHSLQQLVNNARTQQGAMEDKWAEGRRERGEAGGKYGW